MADAKISELVGAATPLAGTEVLPIVQGATTKKVSVASLTDGRSVNTGQLTVTNAAGGATTANYLAVRGSVADNSNYPGIELQGGSLYQAGRAPKLQLANAGLGVGLYSGYINATFTAQYGIYMDSSIGLSLLSSTSGVPSARLSVSDVGNVTINTGNLVIGTSGKGIDFSATAGTGTSELFSDYEEGTFTPDQGVGLTVVGAFSSEGRYTKIGRTITIQGYVAGATSIAVSTNGQMFTNAPFVATLTTAGSAAGYTIGNSACLIINGTSTVSSNTAIGASSAILFTMTYSV